MAEAEIKRHLCNQEPENFTGLETLNGALLHPHYLLNPRFLSNPRVKVSIGVVGFYFPYFTTNPNFFKFLSFPLTGFSKISGIYHLSLRGKMMMLSSLPRSGHKMLLKQDCITLL